MNRYPLILPHPQIRRMLIGQPSALILARKPRHGTQQVHDALAIARNNNHRRQGRPDLQQDPLACTIDITNTTRGRLVDLDQITVRHAGFKTTEDFFLEWLQRRRRIDVDLEVHVCGFKLVEDARYLHARVARGYTNDVSLAARDEPQALSRSELADLARRALARHEQEHAGEVLFQRVRSINIRAKEASRQEDRATLTQLGAELMLLGRGTAAINGIFG